jgi:2-oxoglutarate dehydrogenase complex dehydrogenase (E1) component-like enzyme
MLMVVGPMEMAPNARFQSILADPTSNTPKVDRIVVPIRKQYYDLIKERQDRELSDRVALILLEGISPFTIDELRTALKRYAKARRSLGCKRSPGTVERLRISSRGRIIT